MVLLRNMPDSSISFQSKAHLYTFIFPMNVLSTNFECCLGKGCCMSDVIWYFHFGSIYFVLNPNFYSMVEDSSTTQGSFLTVLHDENLATFNETQDV